MIKDLLLPFCLLFCCNLNGQLIQYSTGFDSPSEKAGWVQYKLGVDSSPYQWSYTTMMPYTTPEALSHNYPVGGTQQTDDWFVSPQLLLPQGGSLDSLYYSFSGFGTPGPGDTIAIYLLESSSDPAAAASRTLLYNFTDSNYVSDNTWKKLPPLTLPPLFQYGYLAFRYTTVVNWLDVKIDAIYITHGVSGTPENEAFSLKVFPVPSGNRLFVEAENGLEGVVCLTDLAGKAVISKSVSGNFDLDVSFLPAGVYFLRLVSVSGNSMVRRVVLE